MKRKLWVFLTVVIFLCATFLILSFRDPFGARSLIPNLEPYPDTLYYSVPAWNLVHGHGFTMFFQGATIKNITPPLYSLFLLPFFYLFKDVRVFYFANELLLLASVIIYSLTIRNLYGDKWNSIILTGILGFFLVTNFYFYTLPTLLMAENLTVFFVIAELYLLSTNSSRKKTLLAGLLGPALILTKFSNLPLGVLFPLIYFHKIGKSKKKNNFALISFCSFLIVGIYIFATGILLHHKNFQAGTGFSPRYFISNLTFYLNALSGKDSIFLWFRYAVASLLISVMSFSGLCIGLIMKKYRSYTIYFLLLIAGLIGFMSFFYTKDSRYIFAVVPAFLLFAGNTLDFIERKTNPTVLAILSFCLIGLYLIVPSFNQVGGEKAMTTFRKQIGLNFKYKEDPWNYLAIREFNRYFKNKDPQKTYLGLILPPYYVQFFTNTHYQYLPVTKHQEFFTDFNSPLRKLFPGTLINYYTALLKKNKAVFVSNYYVNNSREWKKDYEQLISEFTIRKMSDSCLGSCAIYQLTLK